MECFITTDNYKKIDQFLEPVPDEINQLSSKPFNMFNMEVPANHNLIKWDDKIMLNIDVILNQFFVTLPPFTNTFYNHIFYNSLQRKDKTMHIPLSFCTIDPLNKTLKFKNIYRAVISATKNVIIFSQIAYDLKKKIFMIG